MKRMFAKPNMDATSKSSLINALIRPIGMVLSIVYTPILLDYLGTEANGIWATVLSIITWINYCDLGIGNGLRNLLTKELANDDLESAQKSVSTAYIILSGISFILLLMLLFLSRCINWNTVFKTELSVDAMMTITVVFVVVNFVLALSNSILYALQLSERVGVRSCLVQVINIIALLILRRIENGNLTHMAILFGMSTSAVYIFNTVGIFKKYKHLVPRTTHYDKSKIRSICSFGTQYFIIQLTAVLIFSSHNFLATYLYGAAEVTPLTIVNNVYAAGYSVIAAFVIPMWSRTTSAIEKREFDWIRKAIKNVRRLAYVFVVGYILVAFLFKDIARIWLGKELNYQPWVICTTCLFYILQTANLVYTQFLYGIGEIKQHMIITIIQAIIIVPLAYMVCITFGVGIAGVKLAASMVLLITAISSPIITYKSLKKYEKDNGITKNG